MDSLLYIAQSLPDIPRWVEVRDYLLSEECEILGFEETPALSFVLRASDEEVAYVIGEPATKAIINAVENFHAEGVLIAPQEQYERLTPLLPAWTAERIFVYTLKDTQHLPYDERILVRFLEPADLIGAEIDPELLEELHAALAYTPILAIFVEAHPVSFCYASSETESLWDVGIDTVSEQQRKGYASLCFSQLARQMQQKGKSVVWQALESNPASWHMAQKLGFTKVDTLAIFVRDK